MIKTNTAILLLFVMLILTSCYKDVTKASNQENLGTWEILTQSPVKGGPVPVGVDIVFFDQKNGIAEHTFQIRKTNNGGRDWDIIHSFDHKAIRSLVFTNENIGWIVGNEVGSNKPFILNSRDRGESWQEVIFDEQDAETINKKFTSFNDICFSSPEKGWIGGSGGILEISIDRQNMKIINQFFVKEKLNKISCDDNGEVWGVGGEGYIYHFQNSWKKKQIDKTYTFRKVKLTGDNIWLLGYQRNLQSGDISGILLRSKDEGVTWENKTPEIIKEFNDLYFGEKEGWLVGSSGNIFHSNDNGDSWKKFRSPTQNNLENIYFMDKKNIWIGGTNQTILKFKPN